MAQKRSSFFRCGVTFNLFRLTVPRLTLALATIALVGCSPVPETIVNVTAPTPQAPAPQYDKDLSCRTLMARLNDKTSKPAAAQTYSTERHFQRVERRNCDGTVLSNKIETVKAPRVDIRLSLASEKPFKSVFVFDESSCDHKLTTMPIVNFPLLGDFYAVTGDGSRMITLKGDLATGLLTFEIKEGLNKIFVEYHHDCRPQGIDGNVRVSVGDANCRESVDKEIVMYPVTIEHSEKLLDGVKVIEAEPRDCKKK